jgi:hypothetical protein
LMLRAAATFWRVWTRAGVLAANGDLIVRALHFVRAYVTSRIS